MTNNDIKNLDKLPKGVDFTEIDIWPAVKRTKYSLKRLIELGYVEQITFDGIESKYRRI